MWPLAVLLAIQPVASATYLLAIRSGWMEPHVAPAAVLGVFPGAALAGAMMVPRAGRRRPLWAIAAALLEIAWNVLLVAIVSFGVAWRSL